MPCFELPASLFETARATARAITAFCTPVRAEPEPQLHVREVDRRFILGGDLLVLGLRIGLLMRLHDHRGLFERLCRSRLLFRFGVLAATCTAAIAIAFPCSQHGLSLLHS